MKSAILFPCLLLACLLQGSPSVSLSGHPAGFQFTDTIPEFSYRGKSFAEFIMDNMRYPQQMVDQGKSDRIMVDFTVRKDGSVENVFCRDSACHDSLFVREAIRVVSLSDGYWKPGKIKGIPSDFRMRIPIHFRLEE